MSTKAYKLDPRLLPIASSSNLSFDYTHSDIDVLLQSIGRRIPYDNGGLFMPLVILRTELEEMKKELKENPRKYDNWDNVGKILDEIEEDMNYQFGAESVLFRHFVIYWLN